MNANFTTRNLALAASLLFAPALAFAQQGPPPPAAPGEPVPRMHGYQGPSGHQGPGRESGREGGHDMMGGLPPGMWWKDPRIVAGLGLTPDQQKKMEDIFIQSRTQLIQLHANLEQQQLLLEPILDANPVDQPKPLAQISRIADGRAELEKTNAKMLLSMRSTLTPDQWTKLQADHHGHHESPGRPQGAGGPQGIKRGLGGPGGPPPNPLDDMLQ